MPLDAVLVFSIKHDIEVLSLLPKPLKSHLIQTRFAFPSQPSLDCSIEYGR